MLKPGDVMVLRPGAGMRPEWPTALVVAIDRGEVTRESDGMRITDRRIASVTLLVTGPQIIKRDFTWVARNYRHIDAIS